MKALMVILLSAMLTDNFVLSKFMGICPFLGVSKKLDSASGMGIAVTFVMICATAVTYPIHHAVLVPNGLEYFDTVVFILVIALFVQLVETALKKTIPSLYKSLGVYLPLITTNCAVLGVAIDNASKGYNFAQSIVYGLGTAIGYAISICLLAGIRERLDGNDVPYSFQGMPIVLITACLMAIAFFGFSGLKM